MLKLELKKVAVDSWEAAVKPSKLTRKLRKSLKNTQELKLKSKLKKIKYLLIKQLIKKMTKEILRWLIERDVNQWSLK